VQYVCLYVANVGSECDSSKCDTNVENERKMDESVYVCRPWTAKESKQNWS